MQRIEDIGTFNAVRESGMTKLLPPVPRIAVGMGTCGRGNGAEGLTTRLARRSIATGTTIYLAAVGCFGACYQEPLVNVSHSGTAAADSAPGAGRRTRSAFCHDVVHGNVSAGPCLPQNRGVGPHHRRSSLWHGISGDTSWNELAFFKGQKKIVLRNCGLISPDDIEEYIAVGGYQALYKALIDAKPESIIEQVKASKLRGRGGAGFLTGNKWEFLAKAKADQKYIICNADEGDPGAYMNRNEIESDPHALLEGMIIGGYVMGATQGIIYVRAEYPLAVHRLERAIEQARDYGVLGDEHPGTRLQVRHSRWWRARARLFAERRRR